ncbi:MAG: hypothetical protein ACE363_11860 [Alphaproteobacteria bacterium]
MGKYVFVVQSEPTEGNEDAYNDWYDNVHLGEVLTVPGFVAAQRFKVQDGSEGLQYLALYELDTDDPQASLAALGAGIKAGDIHMSDAINGPTIQSTMYGPIGERMTA